MAKRTPSKWLPKDERKLLMIYYYKIQQLMDQHSIPFNEQQEYSIEDLSKAFRSSNIRLDVPRCLRTLRPLRQRDSTGFPRTLEYNTSILKTLSRIVSLSIALQADELIVTNIPTNMDNSNVHCFLLDHTEINVHFTRDGYNLAREYSCFWHRLRLVYNAYIKNHPVTILITAIISIIVTAIAMLIYDWLKNGTT